MGWANFVSGVHAFSWAVFCCESVDARGFGHWIFPSCLSGICKGFVQ